MMENKYEEEELIDMISDAMIINDELESISEEIED